MRICIDVFSPVYMKWMGKYDFHYVRGMHGDYYSIKTDKEECQHIVRICRRKRIKFRCYEERWSRSSNYRTVFLKTFGPPYKCRYCRKGLNKDTLVVDHIVPVEKTKKNINARMILYIQGIDNVNDIRNLAPACHRCNKLKGERMGIWVLRGVLGKYKVYWIFRRILLLVIILLIIIGIFNINDFFDYILSFFH